MLLGRVSGGTTKNGDIELSEQDPAKIVKEGDTELTEQELGRTFGGS